MKKKNINYGSLKERGITKAWDKACVFAYAENENEFMLVLYYAGKPFETWPTKTPFDVEKIRISISSSIDYHSVIKQIDRKVSKLLARYFLKKEAGKRLVTYRHGGVLFPKEA